MKLVLAVAASFGIVSQNANYFMGRLALRCLRGPATSPYPKPDEFSWYTSTLSHLRFHLIWYYPVRCACAFQSISVTARLHPQVPIILHGRLHCESHKLDGPPTSVTWLQLLRKQTNTGAATILIAETLIHARTNKRTLQTCTISLDLLTFPAPEAGDFV